MNNGCTLFLTHSVTSSQLINKMSAYAMILCIDFLTVKNWINLNNLL